MSPCGGCRGGYEKRYGPERLCWECWAQAHGGGRGIPEPVIENWKPREITSREVLDLRKRPPHGMAPATIDVIERFARVLGPPVATPDVIYDGGKLVPSRYRVFRWRCPCCGGGESDPDQIYRPMAVDSDGRVFASTVPRRSRRSPGRSRS
jgi:hypothetical protein